MAHAARLFPVAFLSSLLVAASCFIFVDNPTATSASSGGPPDAGEGADAENEPSMCEPDGGYERVALLVGDVMDQVHADCHINAFFVHLTPDQQQHLTDCLAKQVAFLLRCEGIKYDVDSNGADCRAMKPSHHGLGIRKMDFDRFLEDMRTALETNGLSADDYAALQPALDYLRVDIVTNSAPGYSKDSCPDGG